MVRKRELDKERARTKRALEQQASRELAAQRASNLANVLQCIRDILCSEEFLVLARTQGIRSLPRCLTENELCEREIPQSLEPLAKFIVAWKFLSSILQDDQIRQFVEARWPDFISRFKDAFIAIVANGPFPEERKRTLPSLGQRH